MERSQLCCILPSIFIDKCEHWLLTRCDAQRFVNGAAIGMAYRVDKLPFAVLLDDQGVIAAKGLVNSREHFESLIVAKETGFASIQSYLKAQPEPAE